MQKNEELIIAARDGDIMKVRQLLNEGCDVNQPASGFTPLGLAAGAGNTEIVSLLLNKGADVNGRNSYGSPPLHATAGKGHTETARLLIEKGADVNLGNSDGETPLYNAAWHGHVEMVELLLQNGADPNVQEKKGETSLHGSAKRGHTKITALLLDKGADVSAHTRDGWTPLHLASGEGHTETAALLIERGADVNARGMNDKTSLSEAAWFGRTETSKLLLEKGADSGMQDAFGKTPLQRAVEFNHPDTAALLKGGILMIHANKKDLQEGDVGHPISAEPAIAVDPGANTQTVLGGGNSAPVEHLYPTPLADSGTSIKQESAKPISNAEPKTSQPEITPTMMGRATCPKCGTATVLAKRVKASRKTGKAISWFVNLVIGGLMLAWAGLGLLVMVLALTRNETETLWVGILNMFIWGIPGAWLVYIYANGITTTLFKCTNCRHKWTEPGEEFRRRKLSAVPQTFTSAENTKREAIRKRNNIIIILAVILFAVNWWIPEDSPGKALTLHLIAVWIAALAFCGAYASNFMIKKGRSPALGWILGVCLPGIGFAVCAFLPQKMVYEDKKEGSSSPSPHSTLTESRTLESIKTAEQAQIHSQPPLPAIANSASMAANEASSEKQDSKGKEETDPSLIKTQKSSYKLIQGVGGNVDGVWLRDSDLAQDPTRLLFLLAKEGLPEVAKQMVRAGKYRVVLNTNDNLGGCFVMWDAATEPQDMKVAEPVMPKPEEFKSAPMKEYLPTEDIASKVKPLVLEENITKADFHPQKKNGRVRLLFGLGALVITVIVLVIVLIATGLFGLARRKICPPDGNWKTDSPLGLSGFEVSACKVKNPVYSVLAGGRLTIGLSGAECSIEQDGQFTCQETQGGTLTVTGKFTSDSQAQGTMIIQQDLIWALANWTKISPVNGQQSPPHQPVPAARPPNLLLINGQQHL